MLLTIFVPTNSSQYVISLIKKFLMWNSNNAELLITVNGVDRYEVFKQIKELLELDHKNIRLYLLESKNFIDSINDSIPLIKGEYVTFIGNDDSFLYHIEEVVMFAKKSNIDAIKYPLSMVYFWPGMKNKESQLITLLNKRYNDIKYTNPRNDIKCLLSQVGQNYIELNLVNFYHGVVKKELLFDNLEKIGKFVGGFSPDIYFAYTLSHSTNKIMIYNLPLTVPGIGNRSASESSLKRKHQSNLEMSPIKDYNDIYRWNKSIPNFYSVETVWASTLLISHEDLFNEIIPDFNFKLLNLIIYSKNSYYRLNNKLFKQLKCLNLTNLISIIYFAFRKFVKRINSGFWNRLVLTNVSIDEMEIIFDKEFKSFNNLVIGLKRSDNKSN